MDFDIVEKRILYENCMFSNERPDQKFIKEKLEITHSKFDNIGFRESKISNSDLTHNIFINCYFKKTKIWNVDFTGCKFINCQFEGVEIQHSDFIYTEFENCCIDFDSMFNNLPAEYNLRAKLCRNLALEALKVAMDTDYKKYFLEMKMSNEKHYYETFRLHPKVYYKKKTVGQRFIAIGNYIKSKFSKIIWGYGENVQQLLISMGVIVLLYSLVFWKSGEVFKNSLESTELYQLSYWESLYFSILNFCTASAGYIPNDFYTQALVASENLIGVIFIGCFVTVMYKNICRR
jgi:hypothetical protein